MWDTFLRGDFFGIAHRKNIIYKKKVSSINNYRTRRKGYGRKQRVS